MNKVQESPNTHSIVTVCSKNERRGNLTTENRDVFQWFCLIIVVKNPKIKKQPK